MAKKKNLAIEILGWYGAAAILGAYTLMSFGSITSSDTVYQFLNLTGAIGIIVISVHKGARQPAVLNVFWAIVAAVALLQIIIK